MDETQDGGPHVRLVTPPLPPGSDGEREGEYGASLEVAAGYVAVREVPARLAGLKAAGVTVHALTLPGAASSTLKQMALATGGFYQELTDLAKLVSREQQRESETS